MFWKYVKQQFSQRPLVWQLTALYSLSTMAILLLMSGIVYALFYYRLDTKTQQFLMHAKLLEDYWEVLNGVVIFAVLLSALLGWFLARRSMRPLAFIMNTIEEASTQKLQNRLKPHDWPKEFTHLSEKLNDMFARLDEAFKRLTAFSSDLAHELRTPIHNLKGEAEACLLKARTPEEYQQVLSSHLEEYTRLTRLIDGLLFLAKAELPETQINCKTINIKTLIEAVFEFYYPVAEEKGISLQCVGDAKVCADELLLERVFHNLCSNALRHTSSGGKITATIEKNITQILIRFEDTGSGVAPEHMPHILERFYRGDEKATIGSGLGLAIVKSIMDLHQGHIAINSILGEGTTVSLSFPKRDVYRIKGG